MEDAELNYIICVPESWAHSDTSVLARCIDCECSVWISESGKNTAEEFNASILCLECAAKHDDLGELMPPTPEQLAAVQRNIQKQADKN